MGIIRLLCALFFTVAAAACTAQPAPSTSTLNPDPPREIGGARPARVEYPADYSTSKRYPLVVMLHGYGANALAQNAIFGLKERVERMQFILVMPEGLKDSDGKRFWNATPECCNIDNRSNDDVAYLRGLVEEAERIYAVDPAQVAFVGHSNGGYMSYRMACEAPELINRIGVLAGSVFLDEADCKGKTPVSVVHVHGTADEIVPYPPQSNPPPSGAIEWALQTVGAEAALERWRVKAGCAATKPTPTHADFLSIEGAETDIYRWSECSEERIIELWKMNDGDHLVLDVNDAWRDRLAEYLVGRD